MEGWRGQGGGWSLETEEWLSEQVWSGWFDRGWESRKSRFREHGKDEHSLHWEFNEGNFENKEQYVSCTRKKNENNKTRTTTQWVRLWLLLVLLFCVCAPLGPYGGVNTVTDPGHRIQIRR